MIPGQRCLLGAAISDPKFARVAALHYSSLQTAQGEYEYGVAFSSVGREVERRKLMAYMGRVGGEVYTGMVGGQR